MVPVCDKRYHMIYTIDFAILGRRLRHRGTIHCVTNKLLNRKIKAFYDLIHLFINAPEKEKG